MRIIVSNMKGSLPVIDEHLLPENYASSTLNFLPEGVSLNPIRESIATAFDVNQASKTFAPYHYDKSLMVERGDSGNVVRGPIANDAYDRVYSAGNAEHPKVHYMYGGLLSQDLGVKPPQTPAVDVSWETADPGDPSVAVYNSVYYTTAVSILGEESEPSLTSNIITRWDGANVEVFIGFGNDQRTEKIRLYRSDGGGVFQYVGERSPSTVNVSIIDSVNSYELGYVCESETFKQPNEGLQVLANMGNGVLASYFGNTLCFCEPYYPHAWPSEYYYSVPGEITGIASVSGALIVATNSNPFIFHGTHPAAMSSQKLDMTAACLSPRGIVDMGEYVLYPSREGLISATATNIGNATKNIFSREQWLALDPASFIAFRYRDKYLCFASTGAFMIDIESGYWPIEPTENPDDSILNAHYDAEEDKLYLLVKHSDDSVSVRVFDDGENKKTGVWRSREFRKGPDAVFSSIRIDADAGSVAKVVGSGRYGDEYSAAIVVEDDRGQRLPSGRYDKFSIELESTGRVNMVAIAGSLRELA